MNKITLILFLLGISELAFAAPLGDCSGENPNSETVMCEAWEKENWHHDHGFVGDGGLPPFPKINDETQMEKASIVSTGCLSGKCLQLETRLGSTRSLAIHWPMSNAGIEPQEMYFRYYMKTGPTWTANQCKDGVVSSYNNGKLIGFADARVGSDPGGRCGNGGASSDGINCWSARGLFQGCTDRKYSNGFKYGDTCDNKPGAVARIGSYIYTPNNSVAHGAHGLWDKFPDAVTFGDDWDSNICWRGDPNNMDPKCYCNSTNNVYCGIGTGGIIVREKWHAIETYVKLNTQGKADGIIRGWVDGKLSYEKKNNLFRYTGHDNLHIRTLWLNIYKGGTGGNCENGHIYLDQLVISKSPIGILGSVPDISIPSAPTSLKVN